MKKMLVGGQGHHADSCRSGYDFNGTRDPFAHWYYGTPWYKRAMDSIFASASSVKSPFLRQNKTDEVKLDEVVVKG